MCASARVGETRTNVEPEGGMRSVDYIQAASIYPIRSSGSTRQIFVALVVMWWQAVLLVQISMTKKNNRKSIFHAKKNIWYLSVNETFCIDPFTSEEKKKLTVVRIIVE